MYTVFYMIPFFFVGYSVYSCILDSVFHGHKKEEGEANEYRIRFWGYAVPITVLFFILYSFIPHFKEWYVSWVFGIIALAVRMILQKYIEKKRNEASLQYMVKQFHDLEQFGNLMRELHKQEQTQENKEEKQN